MSDPCLCTALRQAAALGTERYDAALRPAGIKATMYRLLKHVGEADGASITDLAAALGLDRSTLGRNIRVLEKQGLVDMHQGADGRARCVRLTAKGGATFERAQPLWQAAQAEFAALVGPEAQQMIHRLAALKAADTIDTPHSEAPR